MRIHVWSQAGNGPRHESVVGFATAADVTPRKRSPRWMAWTLALANIGALAWACLRSLRP